MGCDVERGPGQRTTDHPGDQHPTTRVNNVLIRPPTTRDDATVRVKSWRAMHVGAGQEVLELVVLSATL